MIVHMCSMFSFAYQNKTNVFLKFTMFCVLLFSVKPLLAYAEPRIPTQLGRSVRLRCVVLWGSPLPSLVWMKGGQVVRNTQKVSYFVKKLKHTNLLSYPRIRQNPAFNLLL